MELSDESAKLDEIELSIYGFCSTQLYTDYREKIDNKLKFTMVELAKYYEEYIPLDGKDFNNEMLFGQYKEFWVMAEPRLQQFYEEIREILALPPNFTPKEISPNEVFWTSEIEKLETEIEQLREKYMTEKYILQELKHRQNVVETICQPLNEKMVHAMNIYRSSKRKWDSLKESDQKRTEMMASFMNNFNKKNLFKVIQLDLKIKEGMRDSFLKMRVEEHDSSQE